MSSDGGAKVHARGVAHSHGHRLPDNAITRSHAGLRAVFFALLILALAAAAQALFFVATGSVALLADLIHNAGDAATAIPLGIAFALGSAGAERLAGLAVVAAIFLSACVAGYEAVGRLIDPRPVSDLGALALAGAVGFAGNWGAAAVRRRAGRRLNSAALVADGDHARADAYLSLAVVASAAALALGVEAADPVIGLAISAVILGISWRSWLLVRSGHSRGGAT